MISRSAKYNLHGGLRFNKSTAAAIEELPIPARLKIAIKQHQGEPGTPLVAVGDTVQRDQPLTTGDRLSQVPVHASSSGIVESITDQYICITTDGKDQPYASSAPQAKAWTRQALINNLHRHGIVGLGGAGFPGAQKIDNIAGDIKVLLINGAECDPIIQCDDALMTNHAREIVKAIQLLASTCHVESVFIGIEDNKVAAFDAISQAVTTAHLNASVIKVPAIYPSGAEKILLQLCTGIQHSPNSKFSDAGILTFNIASCYAIYQSLYKNLPLTSRITTVVNSDGQHHNFLTRIGTPIVELIAQSAGNEISPNVDQYRITSGGHIMSDLISADATIVKSSNCIALQKAAPAENPRSCIRCGACADVCPEKLLPQHLFTHAKFFNAGFLQKLQLDRCIECRCCDVVCPSHLPLTALFRSAKQQTSDLLQANQAADLAKHRFEKRQRRLATATKLSTGIKKGDADNLANTDQILAGKEQEQARKKLIEAALQRSRNKSRNKRPGSSEPGNKQSTHHSDTDHSKGGDS